MRVTLPSLILLTMALTILISCNPQQVRSETQIVAEVRATPTLATFDRQAILKNIVDTRITPLHEQFVTETGALQQYVYQFRDTPTPENLAQVQVQWQTTAAAWAQTEHLGFRFTMVVHNQIKKWPVNASFIEKFISEETDPLDEPFIESLGSTSKGLTALEYLIFNPEVSQVELAEQLAAQPRRLAYVVGLAENLHRKSQELRLIWASEGDNQAQAFSEADFSPNDIQGSLSMLANEMIATVETIANTKLNYPRTGAYGTPQPQAVESPYAEYAIPLIAHNLRSLQQTFNAGLADYLDFVQADQTNGSLAAAINHQFEQALVAVEAVSPSLEVAVLDDPTAVERAYNEVKALLVLLKVDMANQMAITITFSDNDGD